MSGKINPDSPLVNVTSEIEERRTDLISRHRHLKDKVTTIERSIPALLAYNMWMADGRDCPETPYNKVREIVNKISPQSDPADRLLAELRSTVNELHQETAQLHDKIIDADVKLEETAMELESLELANKETEEKLKGLQSEIQRHSTPSLHSIHSEDLISLKKIRQLAEEEFKLKNCIKELKDKEIMFRRQMNQLMSCKKFQRDNVKKTCCSCPTSVTSPTYEKTLKKFQMCDKPCPFSYHCPADSRTPCAIYKSHGCRVSCKSCQAVSTSVFKTESPCSKTLASKSLSGTTSKKDTSRSLKQFTHLSVPCDPGKTCEECETPAACKKIGNCKCACDGKCIPELSIPPCNVVPLTPIERTAYKSTASKEMLLDPEIEDSNSDDEFCECCSCCESGENSS